MAKNIIKNPSKLKSISQMMNFEPYEIKNQFDQDLNNFKTVFSKATLNPSRKRKRIFSRANPRSRVQSVKPMVKIL